MECDRKVFTSSIIRCNNKVKNNLYDLLNIIPVQPLPENTINTTHNYCGFVPKTDKIYVPKKKNGRKVLTVRGIRNIFEKDVYSDLLVDLEKQQNILLRKIRYGFSKDEKTKDLAVNMLKMDTPISKPAWQMLMNINPEEHTFSSQYILWNGKCIQINGSKGGKHKFICNYDIGIYKKSEKKSVSKSTILSKRKQLLHRSLSVKFKPGPLTKKIHLDVSYQKYHYGEIDLIGLPKAGVEIEPSYGKPLPPLIETFINKSFFPSDGLLTQKWAEFAVSVLGKYERGQGIRQDGESCVTFDLNYKCFQNRLLMRHDREFLKQTMGNTITSVSEENVSINSEVQSLMSDVLDSVEINLKQDDMYTGEDEPREIPAGNSINSITCTNTKNKRKKELHRLDVTVITLSESTEPNKTRCQKDYCNLGCICDSLKCSYTLKRHCGRIECMFKCKCDFSNYKYMNSFDKDDCSDIIPGLINLDKTLGQTLAKEEHKFHQTVIVRDDKSILLKSDRRNWKASKKYADFYSKMPLKSERNLIQTFSIVCPNIDCKNIEPWCMVHNLYKCFCKGRFTESRRNDLEENITIADDSSISETVSDSAGIPKITSTNEVITIRPRLLRENFSKENHVSEKDIKINAIFSDDTDTCARVQPYLARKYTDEYYASTNKKILEMEKNDVTLLKKMRSLIGLRTDLQLIENKNDEVANDVQLLPSSSNKFLGNVIEYNNQHNSMTKRLPGRIRLVTWLEESYKKYKQQVEEGLVKHALEAPCVGKVRLYTWEFILSRYRERQNYFFITNQKPFRIFIGVDTNIEMFDDCTNLNDINLSDIDKYPVTVKNLLTNATDLKENFCILRGLSHCWELAGSVTKIPESRGKITQEENGIEQLMISDESSSELNTSFDSINVEDFPVIIADNDKCELQEQSSDNLPDKSDSVLIAQSKIIKSKWFVMKIEDDFSELQFFKKGFFVRYESILKSITDARHYKKTVRLSLRKCSNNQKYPQFGIYAIPNNDDCCVFIGPYKKDESLGIEKIKKTQSVGSLFTRYRTRGIWIITNKVDDMKVIDDPLQFISPSCLVNNRMVPLDNKAKYNEITNDTSSNIQINDSDKSKSNEITIIKQVKPIKIRKTDGFYHLTPNGCLKPIKSPIKKDFNDKSLLIDTHVRNIKGTLMKNSIKTLSKTISKSKANAEIVPLIKICNADNNIPQAQNKRQQRGMFILKPEEINKRSFETSLLNEQPQTSQQHVENDDVKDEISMDIEKFLESSVACYPPTDEILVISDEDNEMDSVRELYKDVWIICNNVKNLGWISGKKNLEQNISFEFPGFKSSAFYPEYEALKKITEILARKVYVPKHIKLQWQVIESEAEIESIEKLEANYLTSDYILTKNGLRHKSDLKPSLEPSTDDEDVKPKVIKHSESKNVASQSLTQLAQNAKMMEYLEETSQTLEDESSFLWNETISKRDAIMASFSETSEEFRSECSEQLNCILSEIDE